MDVADHIVSDVADVALGGVIGLAATLDPDHQRVDDARITAFTSVFDFQQASSRRLRSGSVVGSGTRMARIRQSRRATLRPWSD